MSITTNNISENEGNELFIYHWEEKASESVDLYDNILAYAKTLENKNVLLRFTKFPAWCVFELPRFHNSQSEISWNDEGIREIYINSIVKYFHLCNTELDSDNFTTKYIRWQRLYKPAHTTHPCLKLYFSNVKLMKDTIRKVAWNKKEPTIRGVRGNEIKISIVKRFFEETISTTTKLQTINDINPVGWVYISNKILSTKKRKISDLTLEYIVEDINDIIQIVREPSKEATEKIREFTISNEQNLYITDNYINELEKLRKSISAERESHHNKQNANESQKKTLLNKNLKIVNKNVEEWEVDFCVFSWDIEVQSHNKRAFPNAYDPRDHFYLATVAVEKGTVKNRKRQRYALLYIPGTAEFKFEVQRDCDLRIFRKESETIAAFEDLLLETNPDIIIGFNITGFDYDFLNTRYTIIFNEVWKTLGRLKIPSILLDKSWSSSAYSYNDFRWLNTPGRPIIDLMTVAKRRYKLKQYNLKTVAQTLLGRSKHDVSPFQMFSIREDLIIVNNILATLQLGWKDFPEINKNKLFTTPFDDLILDIEQESDISEELKETIKLKNMLKHLVILKGPKFSAKIKSIDREIISKLYWFTKLQFETVLNYGIEDSELVLDMYNQANMWIDMISAANIESTNPPDLLYRGEQFKAQNQIYRHCLKHKIVMDKSEKLNTGGYKGAIVQKPIIGRSKKVYTLDFSSMYPNIIIEHNICWTTILSEVDCRALVEDKDYKRYKWEEEVEDKTSKEVPKKNGKGMKKVKIITKTIKKYELCVMLASKKKGVLPQVLEKLIKRRTYVRTVLLKQAIQVGNQTLIITYDAEQNNCKISANSKYGMMGVGVGGKLPLKEGAMLVTYLGRNYANKLVDYVLDKYKKFGAKLIYGDTDSIMVSIDPNGKNDKELIQFGIDMEKDVNTNHLRSHETRMKVEFEKLFDELLCLTQKKYMGRLIDKKTGMPNFNKKDLFIRGVLTARRDNCDYQRTFYEMLSDQILLNSDSDTQKVCEQTYDLLLEWCLKLFRRQIRLEELLIIKKMGANYAQDSYPLKIFSDELIKTGKNIKPGDRIAFAIIERPETDKQKLGYKMKLREDIIAEKNKLDYYYYLSNLLEKQIDKLFKIGFDKELLEFEKKHLKVEKKLNDKGVYERAKSIPLKSSSNKSKGDYTVNEKFARIRLKSKMFTYVNDQPMKNFIKLFYQRDKVMSQISETQTLDRAKSKLTELELRKKGMEQVKESSGLSKLIKKIDNIKSEVEDLQNQELILMKAIKKCERKREKKIINLEK